MCLEEECLFKHHPQGLLQDDSLFLARQETKTWVPCSRRPEKGSLGCKRKDRETQIMACQHKDGTDWLQNRATFQSSVLLLPVLSSRQ